MSSRVERMDGLLDRVSREDKKKLFRKRISRWHTGKESACQYRKCKRLSSIPRWGRSPGGGNDSHSSILAWKIPWTEKPGGLMSMGS